MKSAERELTEIERKRQANETKDAANAPKNASEVNRLRIKELSKQIEDETRKLSLARAQVKKLKAQISGKPVSTSKEETVSSAPSKAKAASGEIAGAGKKAPGPARGSTSMPVPEDLYADLCR